MLIGTSAQLRAADHISEIAWLPVRTWSPWKSSNHSVSSSTIVFDFRCPRYSGVQGLQLPHMGLAAHTPFVNSRHCQHIGLQHRGGAHWLLQLNLVWRIYVIDNQAETSAELVGLCGAQATEANSCGAFSTVTSLAAHWTSRNVQAGRSYVQRATHGDASILDSLISNRVTGTRMSLRSSTRSLMTVPRTNTVCASRSFSVCAPVVWNSLRRIFNCVTVLNLLNKNWSHFYSVVPLTVSRSHSASDSSDFMALYKLYYLLTYLLTVLEH